MKEPKEYLSFCHICPGHCSRKFTVEDGKITKVERDQESGLPNEWCTYTKGRIVPEVNTHPDRIKYPQRRVGSKGGGKWERISWDQALDTIAETLNRIRRELGPESVAFCLGEPKGLEFAFAQRFASAFGTPNVATPGGY